MSTQPFDSKENHMSSCVDKHNVSPTVRRGHPKYSPTHCLRLQTPSSRLKPVVGRHFAMPGLPMVQSDVVFKTLSSIELDSSAFLSSHVTI